MDKIKFGVFALATWLVGAVAFAQEAPSGDDLGALIGAVVEAAKGGKWSLFVAVLIMILVFLATKVKFISDLLPNKAKPWVAAVAGVLAAIAGTAMTTGDWLQAVLNGLVTGAAASGLWDMLGKHFLKPKA